MRLRKVLAAGVGHFGDRLRGPVPKRDDPNRHSREARSRRRRARADLEQRRRQPEASGSVKNSAELPRDLEVGRREPER